MVIALIIVLVALLVAFGGVNFEKVTLLQVLIIVIVLGVLLIVWYSLIRIPKCEKGKIGFVIALCSETDEQRQLVQEDFVKEIQAVLDQSRRVIDFDIKVLPKWHAEQIKNTEDAIRYSKSCRAHLLMYGDTRKRKISGKNQFVFRLRQTVLHKIIPINVSDKLAKDFGGIFPSKLQFDEDVQLEGMEIASNWMGEAAKYFIAMAAMVSGDYQFSETLLQNLTKSKLLLRIKGQKGVARIRTRAIERLTEIYLLLSKHILDSWGKEHNDSYMDELNAILNKMETINRQDHYIWKLRKAIWYFVKRGDVENAKRLILSCRGESDAIWRYSLAFLYAFEGDLDNAYSTYKKAFSRPATEGIVVDIEAFISWAIDEYPHKCQLYFCLGLINFRLKEDYISARNDFLQFLECSNVDALYNEQARLVRIWINEISGAE